MERMLQANQFNRWQVFFGTWALFIPLCAPLSPQHPFTVSAIVFGIGGALWMAAANLIFFKKGAGLLRLLTPSLIMYGIIWFGLLRQTGHI